MKKLKLFSLVSGIALLCVLSGVFILNFVTVLSWVDTVSEALANQGLELETPVEGGVTQDLKVHADYALDESEKDDNKNALSQLTYVNNKNLQTISKERIVELYNLGSLEIENKNIKLNNNTRVVVENLFYTLPREEILNNKDRLTDAVTDEFGAEAGKEFSVLLGQFGNYFTELESLDDYRNSMGLTPDEVPNVLDTKLELQNKAFGSEKSQALFQVEREVLAIMMKQREEYRGKTGPFSEDEIQGLIREYDPIIRDPRIQ